MNLAEVNKKIENLHFNGTLCQRAISIEMEPIEKNIQIIAWQCNMASMKTADLKLPTVLRIIVNEEAIVTEAELMENFRGSQGLPCSYVYLNRILKERIIGKSFAEENIVLRDKQIFHCRHIFEMVAASITFYNYCSSCLDRKNTLFEITKAFKAPYGIQAKDECYINDKSIMMEEQLLFSASDISMRTDGKIESINHFGLEFNANCNGEIIASLTDEIFQVSGSGNVIMSMMKMFAAPWKSIGRSLGIRKNYYFSNLMPSSFYGVLIQAIALIIFPNNYNYFQHTLAGLQRNEEGPLCVGMALNMEELHKNYPEFREEDLFG